MKHLEDYLQQIVKGKVYFDAYQRDLHSHDASVFKITPELVIEPIDQHDIQVLIKFIKSHRNQFPNLSLTPWSAGTDMSGGAVTQSISLAMKKFNRIKNIHSNETTIEPGVFYKDLEKQLAKHNTLLPSYPSSKNICTVGGMVANNAGGEKSLQYGKTEKYVQKLKVMLSDGNEYSFEKLSKAELQQKLKLKTFEGEIYNKVSKLIDRNYDIIKRANPKVSKNSTGYNLWNVWDKKTFDLTQLFVGSQGTLGIITEITFATVPIKKYRGMLIGYMKNYDNLPAIVATVLKHNPDCFESFDDATFKLALKYASGFSKILHKSTLKTIASFIPEFTYTLTHGMPKLTVIIEFEGEDQEAVAANIQKLHNELQQYTNLTTHIAKDENEIEKYWAIRRESFNLLRQRVKNRRAAPFIDDVSVDTKVLPEFFPKIYQILNESKLLYTIAGHIGNGNFHIIPLMDMRKKEEREKIYTVCDKVFDLTLSYKGSISGEHNDGLIRAPYLQTMYGDEMYRIFKETKRIFDPDNIFNPHKKIDVTKEYASQFFLRD